MVTIEAESQQFFTTPAQPAGDRPDFLGEEFDPQPAFLTASSDPFDDFEDDDFDDEFDDDFEEDWDDDLEDDGFGAEYQDDEEEEDDAGDTFSDDPDFDE